MRSPCGPGTDVLHGLWWLGDPASCPAGWRDHGIGGDRYTPYMALNESFSLQQPAGGIAGKLAQVHVALGAKGEASLHQTRHDGWLRGLLLAYRRTIESSMLSSGGEKS